ncbi:MAG: class I adenylate-forming enzyme family protein [bacterium]|nr:class I adenylate-forming enzyme family protein [bacterium]
MNKELKTSQLNLNMNFFADEAKNIELPNDTEYNFLYERNKDHMNEIALDFDKMSITYEELHTRIDEYAKALYKRGIRENDIIAISVANTPEAVYIAYALNKLGAIVCPINPLDNSYKILQDLQVVRPKMFIGIQDSYSTFKKASQGMEIDMIVFPAVQSMDSKILKILYGIKQLLNGNVLLSLDGNLKRILNKGKDCKDVVFPKYQKGRMSDIMFTGGSSGTHKGVMLDGNGLNCVVRSLDYVTNLKPGDIFMGNLPQFMAFGKLSLHYALCKNTKVSLTLKALPHFFKEEVFRIKPAGVFAGPIQWEAFVNDVFRQINPQIGNIDFLVNQNMNYKEYLIYLRKIVQEADPKILKDLNMNFLKMGVSGGEQLKMFTELVCNMLFEELGSRDELWNGLGMTEMWAPIAVKMGRKNSFGTLGPMIPFTNQMIVNPTTYEELGINEVGLLCVNGPGMMLGYYENQEETDKVFIEKYGKKWLVTGDIAKMLPNGELQYIDRLKRCFVCGIENIYPQRIENLLSEIPEIREAIVTKISDNELQFIPKYHISLRNADCDIEQLKLKIESLVNKTLGSNHIAKMYEFYETPLPRTANGKLDPKPLQQKDNELKKQLTKK